MVPLAGRPLRVRMLLAALLGIIAALGLAPYGIWIATLAALVALPFLFGADCNARQAGWIGWGFGAGYFAFGLAWIIEPFLVDPERHAWMAPFALVLLAGGLALFWGAAFWGAFRAARNPAWVVWLLVGTLSLVEFARAYVLTGFPWSALAQIWAANDTALLLAWVGPHGLALLTLLAALPPGFALAGRAGRRATLMALVPAVLFAAAIALLSATAGQVELSGKMVRLIQPNAAQDKKWDPEFVQLFFDRQVGYTRQDPRPDLVVWPESAVPILLNNAAPTFAIIAEAAAGTPVVLGIQRLDGTRFYNSLVHLDKNGAVAGIYDKHHLVPFGEYVPFGGLAARFGLSGFAAREGDGYSAGPGPVLLPIAQLGRALPLICYEGVFPQDVAATDGRADFLLQITNDAWFGKNSGPYQHLAQARMRAIEQGLPMVRVANTGISAMIDPLGRLTAQIGLGEAGYADSELPLPLAPTFYARIGDFPVFLLVLTATLALFGIQRRSETGK